jgi:two-component system, NtrC family, response regulator AtoC
MATRAAKRVLIVDDDVAIVRVLQDALGLFRHEHAYTVETAADGAEGLAAIERGQFDLILLDMYMPRMTGLELLAEIRRRGLQTPVLMLTGNEDNKSAATAIKSGVFAYVPKPFDLQQLEMLVSLAAASRSAGAAA